MRLESSPAAKAVLSRNRELSIRQLEAGFEDGLIGRLSKPRMKFPNALCRSPIAGSMAFHEILGLVFQVLEVWLGREAFYRHDELPFVCPGPHIEGRKSVRKTQIVKESGLLSFPRTGC